MSRPWTPEEDEILKRYYHHGGRAAQKALNKYGSRNLGSIYSRAHRLGLQTLPEKHVPLSWIHQIGDRPRASRTAVRRAKQDGVLIARKRTRPKYMVPTWWADQYANEIAGRVDASMDGWWTRKELRERLGVSDVTIHRYTRTQGRTPLAKALYNLESRRGLVGNKLLYHPEQAQAIVTEFRGYT